MDIEVYADVVVLGLPYFMNPLYTYLLVTGNCSNMVGRRVKLDFAGRSAIGVIWKIYDKAPGFCTKKIEEIVDDEPLINDELVKLSEWMGRFYVSSLSDVLTLILPSKKSSGKRVRASALAEVSPAENKIVLNKEQQAALDMLSYDKFGMYYLKGVTGSGKTEVYLSAARIVADSGKSVIYMVPEIALTVQLYSAVLRYFDREEVAVVHSYLTDAARTKAYRDALDGKVKIIIGTRSAVFSPFADIGLIVIDEEQDGSYKSDNSPHFLTRQVAQKRAEYHNCPLLLGSATPSFECLRQTAEGNCVQMVLNKRVHACKMPEMINVDSTELSSPISDVLYKCMRDELDKGNQVILFLNRRGFLFHYKCRECGFEKTCDSCSVSMTYHKSKNLFVCHRCGRTSPLIRKCPVCDKANEMYSGYGTEYVEMTVRQLFPFATTMRMDADTTAGKGAYERIINSFQKKEADILIGTQMVSKGLNFPNVTLVGIIDATSSVVTNDFRADEKLFDLLVQVAGRSGRFAGNGKVVIQSDGSSNHVIDAVRMQRADEFYSEQLEIRRRFRFPPYSRLARIVVRSQDEALAKTIHRQVVSLYENWARDNGGVDVFTCSQCPIYRENNSYRLQLVIRSVNVSNLVSAFSFIKDSIKFKSNFRVEMDIDPQDFL